MMNKYFYGFLGLIHLSYMASCKSAAPSESTVKQIFSDQKRSTIATTSEYSFIMSINKGCTAFILDTEKLIGMTADHCKPKVGSQICWIDEGILNETCTHAGRLDEILEVGPTKQLDYTIFKFSFTDSKIPEGLKAVKLAGTNQLEAAAQNKSPIYMIGYPADEYQKGKMTRSDCLVRDSKVATESERLASQYTSTETSTSTATYPSTDDPFQGQLIHLKAEWKKLGLDQKPSFQNMLESCGYAAPSTPGQDALEDFKELARPSFVSDCSVYGGNSGGPVLAEDSGVVIGMPATYYRAGEQPANPCFVQQTENGQSYWDAFFRPIYSIEMPTSKNENWNTLDRNSTDLKDFPLTIPMHLIVEHSKYLKENPQYVSSEAFKP